MSFEYSGRAAKDTDYAWQLTDPSSALYRRRLPDFQGQPVYEIVYVDELGAQEVFHVAHGRIFFSDYTAEELKQAQCAAQLADSLGRDELGEMAEYLFVGEGPGYDTDDEYDSFEAAEAEVKRIIQTAPSPTKTWYNGSGKVGG